MDNLQEKKFFEAVSVNDELPENRNVVVVEVADKNAINLHGDAYLDEFNGKNQWFLGDYRHDFPVKFTNNVNSWLKEKSGYLLSKEELEKLIGDAFDVGCGAGFTIRVLGKDLTHPSINLTKNEYIHDIFNQQSSTNNK